MTGGEPANRRRPESKITYREAQEVAYEFFALRESMRAWRSTIEVSRPMLPEWYPSGMYIESWFLHARNVLAFLYPSEKPGRDSLTATSFVPEWEELRPPAEAGLGQGTVQSLRQQVNRQVAHLTRHRARENRLHVEVGEVYAYAEALEALVDLFLKSLPTSMVEWFQLDRFWFEGLPTDFCAEDLQTRADSHQGDADC